MRKFVPLCAALCLAMASNAADAAITIDYYSNFTQDDDGITFSGSPYRSETLSSIDLDFGAAGNPAGRPTPNDVFAALVTGQFSVATAGTYSFDLTSDDGSFFFIGGNEVGKIPGFHSPTTESFSVDLEAGVHNFQLNYFNGAATEAVLNLGVPEGVTLITAIPEPSAWLMMTAGLGLIGFALRRQRAVKPTVRVAYAGAF